MVDMFEKIQRVSTVGVTVFAGCAVAGVVSTVLSG
jgi:hypothetical protein